MDRRKILQPQLWSGILKLRATMKIWVLYSGLLWIERIFRTQEQESGFDKRQ
jgi:hypothetical protein